MPQISVIVPVYKTEQYLKDCIESILAQSFSDFELILVDDGSPDHCGEICNEYANIDSRIRVIHQENIGLSGARNSGIEASTGELITFIDSDDFVSVDYLEYLYSILQMSNSDISVVNFEIVNSNAQFSADFKSSKRNYTTVVYSNTECCKKLYETDEKRIPINAWAKLIRKNVIGKLRFPVGRIHEDQYFIPLLCYRASKIIVSDANLYFYRNRNDSITRQLFSLKRYDDIWAIDQCIDIFSIKGEDTICQAAQNKKEKTICRYSLYARHDNIKIPKKYKRSVFTALYQLRDSSPESYEYYLAQISNTLPILYEYYLKLKSILHTD